MTVRLTEQRVLLLTKPERKAVRLFLHFPHLSPPTAIVLSAGVVMNISIEQAGNEFMAQ